MVTCQPLFRVRSAINQLLSIFKIMGTPEEETLPGYTSLCRDHLGFFPPKKTPKDLAKVVPGLEPTGIDLLQVSYRYKFWFIFHIKHMYEGIRYASHCLKLSA